MSLGEAIGVASGNALNWRYTLRLPVDGSIYEVQFDDWMYLVDERVMLNKARMSKFGIFLGEVTVPAGAPQTFGAYHNEVRWTVVIELAKDDPLGPEVHSEVHVITILP